MLWLSGQQSRWRWEVCCGNWERRNMRRNSWFQVTQGNSLFCCLIYISVIINSPTCHLKPKGFYFFHTPQNEMLGRMFQLLFYYIQQQSIAATEVKAIVHPKMKICLHLLVLMFQKSCFLDPNVLHNICSALQKKVSHTGLERHEAKMMTRVFIFGWTLPLNVIFFRRDRNVISFRSHPCSHPSSVFMLYRGG